MTITIIDIRHVFQCQWITVSDAILFLFSVNRNRTTTAAPEWSNITSYTHSPRRTETTIFASAATCMNSPVCRGPACHLSSALSHCPIKEIYSVVKIPLQVCASKFIRFYAVSPSEVGPRKFGSQGPPESSTRLTLILTAVFATRPTGHFWRIKPRPLHPLLHII